MARHLAATGLERGTVVLYQLTFLSRYIALVQYLALVQMLPREQQMASKKNMLDMLDLLMNISSKE